MKTSTGIVKLLSFPLMILNCLGGIVSGIWLAVIKDWSAIGTGILLFFISTFILGIALMPSLLLDAPAAMFAKNGKPLGMLFFGTLSSLYVSLVITLWCLAVFLFYLKGASHASYIPRLIWSYGLATGPWGYMASRDQGPDGQGFGSNVAVLFSQLGYLAIMFVVAIFGMTLIQAVLIFGGFMVLGVVINMTATVVMQREIRAGVEGRF